MKILRKIDSNLLDKYKHNNYNTNKLQNSQLNNKINSDEIKNLNIG